jgi:hypothetical protein
VVYFFDICTRHHTSFAMRPFLLSCFVVLSTSLWGQTDFPNYLVFPGGPVNILTNDGATIRVDHDPVDFAFGSAQGLTVDFWFRPNNLANGFPILFKKPTAPDTTRGFAFYWNQIAQEVRVNLGDADTSIVLEGVPLTVGRWHHLALTVDRGTDIATFLVDGVVVDAKPFAESLTNTSPLVLMGVGSTAVQYTAGSGSLAEIRIWKQTLLNNEIRSIAHEPLVDIANTFAGNSTGKYTQRLFQADQARVVAYYRMTTNSPGSMADNSGLNNFGKHFSGNGQVFFDVATRRRPNDTITNSYFPPPVPHIVRSTQTQLTWEMPQTWYGAMPEPTATNSLILVRPGNVLVLDQPGLSAGTILVLPAGRLIDKGSTGPGILLTGGIRNLGTVLLDSSLVEVTGTDVFFSGSNPIRMRFLEINMDLKAGAVNFDTEVEIVNAGALTLNVGTLETNNNLILKTRPQAPHYSTALATGSAVSDYAFNGNIVMEGYLSNTNPGWRQMGIPLKNVTLGGGQITGLPLLTTSYIANPGARNVYFYDALRAAGPLSQNVGFAKGWTQATSAMGPDRGYSVYIDGNSPLWNANTNFTVTGQPNFGVQSFTMHYSLDPTFDTTGKSVSIIAQARGWNYIPNPFPCGINVPALFGQTVLKNLPYRAAHLWDHSANQYRVLHQAGFGTAINYNNNAANATGTFIPPFAGFWVKNDWNSAGNTPVLNSMGITNSQLATNADLIIHREVNRALLALDLWAEDSTYDQAVFYREKGADNQFDPNLDGYKWHTPVANTPSLYFQTADGVDCALMAREEAVQKVTLRVKPNTTATRMYYLSAQSGAWQSNAMPLLYDKKRNTYHNLNQGPYLFAMEPGEAEDRFELRFDVVPLAVEDPATTPAPLMFAKEGALRIHNPSGEPMEISVIALSGQVIARKTSSASEWSLPLPAKGLYLVQWSQNGVSGVQKVMH